MKYTKKTNIKNTSSKKTITKTFEKQDNYKIQKKSKDLDRKNIENERQINQDDYIFGVEPIKEALKHTTRVNRILISKQRTSKGIQEIIALAKEKKVPINEVETQKIAKIALNQTHQGIIAYVSPFSYKDFKRELEKLGKKEDSVVLVLDHIQDAGNLGAILRSAEGLGVDLVVLPNRRSALVNATVAKAAAGACEYLPICVVSSLFVAIEKLKKQGYWVYGADTSAKTPYYKMDYAKKSVLIVGSEDKGISVSSSCDYGIKIPMKGKINSLNASVACAIVLSEMLKR